MTTISPGSDEEAAAALKELQGATVRPSGNGSRAEWGGKDSDKAVTVHTGGLNRIVAHNPGDFTAIVQAGVPLADLQRHLAREGQWLALDPPDRGGTVGGLVATADSGPARHRYGGVRDLVIGITVVLSDGSVARSGGTVIKNVAGYDLGKLFAGSYGTLGLVTQVALRLHPLPAGTATLVASTADPAALSRAVLAMSRHPLEAMSLDVSWREDAGRLLVRFGGVTAAERAGHAAKLLQDVDTDVVLDDESIWAAQRAAQRGAAVVKVSALPTDLSAVIAAAGDATVISRAALGVSWLSFPPGDNLAERVEAARKALEPRKTAVLDGARLVDAPWPVADPGTLALMRRVKARFDPTGTFRPGTYVGGI
ncbi:glycolate oxidase [Asanoa ishikariensis]|uniref:Glycolate oxidase FAD binding subunit n=1 Tax=Asanoa ishikariensis TaxID=137265 RepID=A0A1H3TW83_9ACTN|nr:FAD-binding oxidoreductase [Asanoa ishikariensis]GIF67577.1 glycolate oxidase [Asanoa ishikariensis]SDZ54308.1 glycolate oxidase FAD binding subunit [Asanoa ishikariensis]